MTESVTIYCRISLDRTGEELGVERQERECRALVEARGWTVERVLVDNDISATSGARRPAFEELLAARPKTVVAWHTDRLVRVSADLERVLDTGASVHTVTSGWLDLSNPAGRAVARTVTAWATYETEQKALRQKAAHVQRRASGKPWWPRAPFGYTRRGEPVEKEAAAIRQACSDVLDGKPVSVIAREWEAAGFRSHRGNPMRPQSVRQVLMHPRNAGIMTQGAYAELVELGQGEWEPIVDELTLRAVRMALSDPERRFGGATRADSALLTGLIFCDVCGGRMGSHTQHQRGKVYSYYSCRDGRHVNWPRKWLDDHVSEVARAVLSRPEWAAGWEGATEDLGGLQEEAQRLTALLDDLLEERLEGKLSTEQYRRIAGKAEAKLEEIRGRLDGADVIVDASKREAHEKAKRWESLRPDEMRECIRLALPKIRLGKPGSGRGKMPDENAIRYAEV